MVVRVAGPLPSWDLLELYFENRRSGGGCVRDVQPLPGGRGAIVTFQELAGEWGFLLEVLGDHGEPSGPLAACPFVTPQLQSGCCRGHTGCRTWCWNSTPTTPSWSCWRGAGTCTWTLSPLWTGPLLLTRSLCCSRTSW